MLIIIRSKQNENQSTGNVFPSIWYNSLRASIISKHTKQQELYTPGVNVNLYQ